MTVQYEDECMSQRKVYKWMEKVKEGQTRVTDDANSGQPMTIICAEVQGTKQHI
jgi:hypothetical protein